MSVLLGITDYVVISLMLATSASVGIFFRFTGGRQKTTAEFLMAGKNMSVLPVAFSLMATYLSAIGVLGVPSETYLYGTQLSMWMVGVVIGGIIACYGFLPVFYNMDVTTAYEYLEKRFGKTTRTVTSFLFTLQMILYMAVVLYAPSLALNAVTGISTWTSVVSLAVVCTFYCSLGGLKAVLWTDVFQAFLMFFSVIAVVVKGVIDSGGISEAYNIAEEGGRIIFFDTTIDLTARYTLWNSIMSGVFFSLNTFGTNQAQIQRMLSVGDLKKAKKALLYSLPLIVIFNVFSFLDGVVIYSNYHDCDPMLDENTKLKSPDQLMPYAIIKMFSHIPGLSGLCIAGIFSAALSTVSSAVNSLTAVTMEDFIRPYCFCKQLTENWATLLAKIIAVCFGGLCLLLTFIVANFRGVLEACNIVFGMVGGPVLGIYLLGMFSKRANEKGTLIGLLVGFTVNAWLGFGSYAIKAKVPRLSQSVTGCPVLNISITETVLNSTKNLIAGEVISTTVSTGIAYSSSLDEERYIFPVYKISYLWFPLIGTLSVFIVGYIASFVTCLLDESKDIKPEYFSPFIRKLYFNSSKKSTKITKGSKGADVEMKEMNSK
ncbi:putative sodium-dependent multivitamin transporter isoform X2 [Parasteatoda tepidariorum]|nr:putative sodium-dependent multivitamin transporter isoform X2 [Parasteatoda tepidariorum]